jgi:hypothetical protein
MCRPNMAVELVCRLESWAAPTDGTGEGAGVGTLVVAPSLMLHPVVMDVTL